MTPSQAAMDKAREIISAWDASHGMMTDLEASIAAALDEAAHERDSMEKERNTWMQQAWKSSDEVDRLKSFLSPAGQQEYLLLEQRDNLRADRDAQVRNRDAWMYEANIKGVEIHELRARLARMEAVVEAARGLVSWPYRESSVKRMVDALATLDGKAGT